MGKYFVNWVNNILEGNGKYEWFDKRVFFNVLMGKNIFVFL